MTQLPNPLPWPYVPPGGSNFGQLTPGAIRIDPDPASEGQSRNNWGQISALLQNLQQQVNYLLYNVYQYGQSQPQVLLNLAGLPTWANGAALGVSGLLPRIVYGTLATALSAGTSAQCNPLQAINGSLPTSRIVVADLTGVMTGIVGDPIIAVENKINGTWSFLAAGCMFYPCTGEGGGGGGTSGSSSSGTSGTSSSSGSSSVYTNPTTALPTSIVNSGQALCTPCQQQTVTVSSGTIFAGDANNSGCGCTGMNNSSFVLQYVGDCLWCGWFGSGGGGGGGGQTFNPIDRPDDGGSDEACDFQWCASTSGANWYVTLTDAYGDVISWYSGPIPGGCSATCYYDDNLGGGQTLGGCVMGNTVDPVMVS